MEEATIQCASKGLNDSYSTRSFPRNVYDFIPSILCRVVYHWRLGMGFTLLFYLTMRIHSFLVVFMDTSIHYQTTHGCRYLSHICTSHHFIANERYFVSQLQRQSQIFASWLVLSTLILARSLNHHI